MERRWSGCHTKAGLSAPRPHEGHKRCVVASSRDCSARWLMCLNQGGFGEAQGSPKHRAHRSAGRRQEAGKQGNSALLFLWRLEVQLLRHGPVPGAKSKPSQCTSSSGSSGSKRLFKPGPQTPSRGRMNLNFDSNLQTAVTKLINLLALPGFFTNT